MMMKDFRVTIKDDWAFETVGVESACSPTTAISRAYAKWKKARRKEGETRRATRLFVDVEMEG